MNKMTLEELGWKFRFGLVEYEEYKNEDKLISIDYGKRKIGISDTVQELSFATLEAIREKVIENAIY